MKNPAMRRSLAAALFLLAVLPLGCGYRFATGGETIAPSIRKVFVETFANRTAEAYADVVFRNAFIGQIVQGGRFILAADASRADAVLRGTVKGLRTQPLSYRPSNLAAEERLTVTLEISFEETATGRTIWSEKNLTATGDYPVTTLGATQTDRRSALAKLAADAAEQAYRLLVTGF